MEPSDNNLTSTTNFRGSVNENESPMLSHNEMRMFLIVNCGFLASVIGIFGIIANVTNIIIFYKRGLDNTVNISLFGIALSDLGCLITTQWLSICLNPYFEESDVPMVTSEIQYLTAGWPHVCFSRITCCITVYVTAERCMCITVPLKVKRIFTPMRTKIAIFSIYILMICSLIPEYATAYIGWKFYPPRNKTVLRLIFTDNRERVQGLVFVLNATLGLLSFAAVTICTAILVWKLKIMAKWRQSSTFNMEQFHIFTLRDKKTVNMIVLIALILIICYTPGTSLLLATFFEPDFSVTGKYVNTFLVLWSFGLLFESINSSVNIFLYYKMSTRYRQTFRQIFYKCRRRESMSTPETENGRSFVKLNQAVYIERSDSDVMYEVSTEFCDLEVPSTNISHQMSTNG